MKHNHYVLSVKEGLLSTLRTYCLIWEAESWCCDYSDGCLGLLMCGTACCTHDTDTTSHLNGIVCDLQMCPDQRTSGGSFSGYICRPASIYMKQQTVFKYQTEVTFSLISI